MALENGDALEIYIETVIALTMTVGFSLRHVLDEESLRAFLKDVEYRASDPDWHAMLAQLAGLGHPADAELLQHQVDDIRMVVEGEGTPQARGPR